MDLPFHLLLYGQRVVTTTTTPVPSSTVMRITQTSSTALSALPPPFVISGVFKRMQEDKQKRGMLHAGTSADEAVRRHRVCRPVWPLPVRRPVGVCRASGGSTKKLNLRKQDLAQIASALSGVRQIEVPDVLSNNNGAEQDTEADEGNNKFNPMENWSERSQQTRYSARSCSDLDTLPTFVRLGAVTLASTSLRWTIVVIVLIRDGDTILPSVGHGRRSQTSDHDGAGTCVGGFS